jgi:serine/threonine protein kinase/formylglycine-generating enzyme required for sulfatase activity
MLCFRCGSYNADDASKCIVCSQDLRDPQKKVSTGQLAALIFLPGELIAGRYKILEQLGVGGVGAVYRARDTEVDVDVALKGVSPNLLQTDEEQKQFSKAIKAARKLQHHNIVRIYDEGQHQQSNRRFFTMKLLEGLTLRKIIRLRHDKGQAFSPEEIIPIFQQLASALDYAHKQTWHGDLKPENIIVLPDLLKVTDFNLVKGLPLKPFLGIAKSRSKGFPYIAPELRVEAQSIDGRVDIYSLGVILGEMLTGLVYEGHFSRAFTAALEQLPTRLDGLVRRALAEHPDGRFSKASEMVKEVEGALGAMGPLPLPPPVALVKEGLSLLPKSASQPPARVPVLPPPPPREETNPSQSSAGLRKPIKRHADEDESLLELGHSQVLLLASAIHQAKAGIVAEAAENLDDTANGPRVDSQLDSGVDSQLDSSPGFSEDSGIEAAEAEVRRLDALIGVSPDDTIDEPTMRGGPDDIDTNPGARLGKRGNKGRSHHHVRGLVSSGERPPGPDELLESIYSDEGDNRLVPPPLPDDGLHDESVNGGFALPGDDEPATDHRARGRAPVPFPSSEPSTRTGVAVDPSSSAPGSGVADLGDLSVSALDSTVGGRVGRTLGSLADEFPSQEPTAEGLQAPAAAPGLTSDDVGSSPSSEGGLEIHDALTALKRHPRPDLVENDAMRDALTRTGGTATGQEPPALPPDLGQDDEDDDSLNATNTMQRVSIGDAGQSPMLPPVLRPVAPPRKPAPSSGVSPYAVFAVVAVAVLLILVAGNQMFGGTAEGDDGAVVTLQPSPLPTLPVTPSEVKPLPPEGEPPSEATLPLPPAVTPAPAELADAAALLRERQRAELLARDEMDRREREAAKVITPAPAPSPTPTKAPAPPVVEPSPASAIVVAVAEAGSCPAAMATIDAGSFSFGSSGSDPMRNFGELDAKAVDVKTFCIDYYEAPNGAKALPSTGVSWTSAKTACERSGKRLCTEQEWERACKGPSSSRFPYGNGFDVDVCNTVDGEGKARPLARAADFKKCRSGFKVFMLAGNAEEWVADAANGQRVVKGGSSDRPDFASRCSARRTLAPKSASGMLGYRCCADLH